MPARCKSVIPDCKWPGDNRARCIFENGHDGYHGAVGFGTCEAHEPGVANVVWSDEPMKVRRVGTRSERRKAADN